MRKQMTLFSVLFAVSILLLAACGGEDGADDEDPIMGSTTFATYNTGLALGYVNYAPEREPLIGEALAKLEADVVCLQEVWTEESAKALIAAADSYKYSWYELTPEEDSGAGEPACTEEEADPLEQCVAEFCADVDAANITSCVLENCGDQFGALSKTCSGCVISNIGKSVEEILSICKEGTEGAGGQFAYEGHNGLLLLSKYELKNPDFKIFESYLNRRVVLNAEITNDEGVLIDVFCTHLTANLSDINYSGEFESWGNEQALQIDELNEYVTAQAADSVAVLMGDMNCGPEKADVVAELPENYKKFIDAGFVDPYVDFEESICSWCAENPLTGGDTVNNIIDHVFFKGYPEGLLLEVKRIFDSTVEIEVDGKTVNTRLSDHYGVQATLNIPLAAE